MRMKCPNCGITLRQVRAAGVVLDVCRDGCAGIWFDRFELEKFDEPHERVGEVLAKLKPKKRFVPEPGGKRDCPKCAGLPMLRHLHSPTSNVVVDECPACGGFWLDPGELATIRGEFRTDKERRLAADKYVTDLLHTHLHEMAKESRERADKAARIARMLCFICPSYYFPDRIKGGAFSIDKIR
jgi:uncharacterized protein